MERFLLNWIAALKKENPKSIQTIPFQTQVYEMYFIYHGSKFDEALALLH